jgi:RNA polymerase sigma-70 factor (ECF subfamily)
MAPALATTNLDQSTDEELVRWVLTGEKSCFEVLMRRYNRRVYRAARAILRDDSEAEDVVQDGYVRAYQHLDQFEGRASFSTWLTRIVVHEALARIKRRRRMEEIDSMDEARKDRVDALTSSATPEQAASAAEVHSLLESSIDALPDSYRHVFVLREVEEMDTRETAECLGISEDNVKMRLHRARAQLRREIYARAGATSTSAFQFMGERCNRMVAVVMQRIHALPRACATDS